MKARNGCKYRCLLNKSTKCSHQSLLIQSLFNATKWNVYIFTFGKTRKISLDSYPKLTASQCAFGVSLLLGDVLKKGLQSMVDSV
jgi:hypothetical protein